MTIEEAVESLSKHLDDPEVFQVSVDGQRIRVEVGFIYRVEDVERLNGMWEGFQVYVGRRSCW